MGRLQEVVAKGYWRADDATVVVDALEASGMSLAAFCRTHGIHANRVARWRKRLRAVSAGPSSGSSPSARTMHFHELAMPAAAPPRWVAEVELMSGYVVRIPTGFDAGELDRLLGVLEPC